MPIWLCAIIGIAIGLVICVGIPAAIAFFAPEFFDELNSW